ncbi:MULTISPECIES: acyltransferase [unclassified Paraburkholderia]|uniref:acyltransferase family protein n=1 Tax=unclassified Paraburkholderia TaxID=2615204 RepID=UPI00161FF5F7|nr:MULTISPECIES: acyltransferase [unclassified Paraburkholderia]MBB5445333.1 peptidoglycan/LPS O-acetylase OafA/YrhL [Paraburkholderia sp. WSM4177]MBB5485881.1 peptidoglycan/LPS O-acetylase OafA/YrhL [Paraburkholderia sp. WSM4180]
MNAPAGTLKNIQVARAVAALSVVAYHLGAMPFGQVGVDVFFVISGFIMSYIAPSDGRAFLAKRIARIVPLYWLLTFGVYAIAVLEPQWLNTTTEGASYLVKSLLFIPYIKENGNWGPLLRNGWTLIYEMFFYLVVAVSILCVRAKYATLLSSVILILACGFASAHGTGNLIADYLMQPLVLEFCLGVACYWIFRSNHFGRIKPAIWVTVAILSVITIAGLNAVFGDPEGFQRVARYGMPAFAIIVSLLGLERSGVIFRNPVLAQMGAASYSIYLLHPYAIGAMEKVLHVHAGISTATGAFAALIAIVAVCVSGWLCFRYVEAPMQGMLKRFRVRAPRVRPSA